MNKSLFYTGVGSRTVPASIHQMMQKLAAQLAKSDYILRSGGAPGSDGAFERGCDSVKGRKEIYRIKDCTPESMDIARRFHGAWSLCDEYARKLHGRNPLQVLGRDLDEPSDFLICWTPDGCLSHNTRTSKTGGTGTAISVADHYCVKIYNLAHPEHFDLLSRWLK